MDVKAALLSQLRIDRPDPAPAHTSGAAQRWWIGLGILIVVLAAAASAWYWHTARGESIAVRAATARAVQSNAAGAPVAGSLLDASGYVVALREATVSAKGIYKVNQVLVQEGERVRKGQVIARLDDSNTRAALEQSQAQVKQAQAELAQARLAAADAAPTYQRDRMQLAQGLISPDTFDATKASFDAAQSAVSVAEQTVAVARASVGVNQSYEDDTVIRAPFSGVVTVKNAQPGEIVSPQFSGGHLGRLTPLHRIHDESRRARGHRRSALSYNAKTANYRNCMGVHRWCRRCPPASSSGREVARRERTSWTVKNAPASGD